MCVFVCLHTGGVCKFVPLRVRTNETSGIRGRHHVCVFMCARACVYLSVRGVCVTVFICMCV